MNLDPESPAVEAKWFDMNGTTVALCLHDLEARYLCSWLVHFAGAKGTVQPWPDVSAAEKAYFQPPRQPPEYIITVAATNRAIRGMILPEYWSENTGPRYRKIEEWLDQTRVFQPAPIELTDAIKTFAADGQVSFIFAPHATAVFHGRLQRLPDPFAGDELIAPPPAAPLHPVNLPSGRATNREALKRALGQHGLEFTVQGGGVIVWKSDNTPRN